MTCPDMNPKRLFVGLFQAVKGQSVFVRVDVDLLWLSQQYDVTLQLLYELQPVGLIIDVSIDTPAVT